jgi:hypothetical protein
MSIQVQKDSDGNVITNPVTHWGLMAAANMSVLLAIQYATTQQELETGDTRQIQFLLTPQACLRLAEELTRMGKSLLEPPSSADKPPN